MQMLVEKVKDQIINSINGALNEAKELNIIEFAQLPEYVLEVPREKDHGDFATNVAMLLSKQAKMPPRQIAEIIVKHIDLNNTCIEKIQIAGPGFINFYLNNTWLYEILSQIATEGPNFGCSNIGEGKKVQVEFVSANPTGLLHMGNARGAAIGDTIAALLDKTGFDVTREFYINDAGNQIENFGKSLEARYLQELGYTVPFPEDGYHGQDIIDTVKKIIELDGKKYVNMDADLRKELLVKYALGEKLAGIKNGLATFGVNYDVWFSEQTMHESGAIENVLSFLRDKGYIYENEGALWFKATEFGDEKDEVVVRSNGTPTYFAADIAYHKNKFDRGFEWVINIWGADHHGHIKRMKGAVEALGYNPEALDVVIMQLVRLFKDGEIVRMSKRSGEFVSLEELLEEVGNDAARYFFVMRSADSHLDFDMDLAKSQSNDNPVFYVQYAHARICSILRQLTDNGEKVPEVSEINQHLIKEEAEILLLRKLADYPVEIAQAAINLEPHRVARYVHELAGLFHSFYNSNRVMLEDKKLQNARLVLINSIRIVIKNALELIGVSVPEKM